MPEPLNPVVVPREACDWPTQCPTGRPCDGCMEDGTRAVLDQAQEVYPSTRKATNKPGRIWAEVDR